METTTLKTEQEKDKSNQTVFGDVVNNRTWQILGILVIIAIAIIYWRTFGFWWKEWWKEESHYSHGMLIPIMSAFLVWFNWKRISQIPVEPIKWGLVIILPMALLQFVVNRAEMASVSGLTLPIVILGISLTLFGKRITTQLLFPILFLFFMCVPPSTILESVSFKIQMLSTTFATGGLKLIGFNAIQNGTQIALENISVFVGAPCSGFRMLIALLAFTAFFVYMKVGPMWGRLSLVVLVFPLSLIANSLRVLLIALVGEYWGEDAMHSFHDYSGYMVLIITFLVLLQIAKVVKCRDFKSMPS